MGKQFRCTKPSGIADCDEESANNSIVTLNIAHNMKPMVNIKNIELY